MKRLNINSTVVLIALFLLALLLSSCDSEEQVAQANEAKTSTTEKQSMDSYSKEENGIRVMTAEDMERLHEERREMIERSTPLNEEHDELDALRQRMTGEK